MPTLAQVRTSVLQRSNMEIDTGVSDEDRFVTNAEVDRLINQGYQELYGYLIRCGMHRAEAVDVITADGSTGYELPADFLALLTVHRIEDDVACLLPRHDHRTRPRTNLGAPAQSYRVVGSDVVFDPVPDTGTYEVRYVPVPGTLSADADTLDGVLGWEEYVILFAAAKLLQKEGSYEAAAQLKADARELMARIHDEAHAAEMSEGTVIQRVRTSVGDSLPGDFITGGRPRLFWW